MKFRGTVVVAWCLAASALLVAQAGGQNQGGQNAPAPPPPKELTAPDIPGVIKGGTKIELIRDGFNGTEGAISLPDGSCAFCEMDANTVLKIDQDGKISTYLEDTNRAAGLTYDPKGRLISTQTRDPKIGVLAPTRQVLADSFEGQRLVRPNDLIADKKGGVYFTDPIPNPKVAFREPPAGRKALIFYIRPDGTLTKLTEEIQRPNGLQLSLDEKTLYATNGDVIVAFDVQPDGSVKNGREFVKSGGDGLAVDNLGRLYAAVGGVKGIRVFSPQGQDLGTIPMGTPPQSVAFCGPDKKTLLVVGQGAAYRTTMLTEGIKSRAK